MQLLELLFPNLFSLFSKLHIFRTEAVIYLFLMTKLRFENEKNAFSGDHP